MEQETVIGWYYYQNGNSVGPLSKQDLTKLLESKTISPETYIWQEGMSKWKLAKELLHRESSTSVSRAPAYTTPTAIPRKYARLRRFPVLLVILLAVLTLGIYVPGWFLLRRAALNSMKSREKLGKKFFICAMGLYSIWALFSLLVFALEGEYTSVEDSSALMYIVYTLLSMIVELILVFQCFKVRQIILDHARLRFGCTMKFNRFLTFFFHIYYLQLKINQFVSESNKIVANSG